MSGKDEEEQQHLFAAGAEFLIYFHCFAPRLHLMLEHSVKNIPATKSIFETVGDNYRFLEFYGSFRELLLEKPFCTHSLIQGSPLVQIIWIVLLTFIKRFC